MNFQTTVGKLQASTICWRESERRIQLSDTQAAGDRTFVAAVEDLVLSQVDNPKQHLSAYEISHETATLRSSVHRIIHRDLQLKFFI